MFKESADEAFKAKNYRNAVGVRCGLLLPTTLSDQETKLAVYACTEYYNADREGSQAHYSRK